MPLLKFRRISKGAFGSEGLPSQRGKPPKERGSHGRVAIGQRQLALASVRNAIN
jgi:hypothetical protein